MNCSKLLAMLCAIAFGVAACAYVPAASLLKLSGLDMLSVDPGQIRVAVALVDVLAVRKGGVVLDIGVRQTAGGPQDSDHFVLLHETGLLQEIGAGNNPGSGDGDTNREAATKVGAKPTSDRQIDQWMLETPGSHISVFKVAERDLDRLRALQKRIRERRARHPGDSGGFLTVSAKACRSGALPQTPLPVTTWLKTRDDQEFFVLTREADLKALMSEEDLLAELPPCAP